MAGVTSHYVAKGKGGRGKKGGLSKYAERLGRKHNTISEFRNAASVAVNLSVDRHLLLDKANHLAAIHKLPEACWPVAGAGRRAGCPGMRRQPGRVGNFLSEIATEQKWRKRCNTCCRFLPSWTKPRTCPRPTPQPRTAALTLGQPRKVSVKRVILSVCGQ